MKKQIVFIHGAGEGAYKSDKLLADSLQQQLEADYEVIYPVMPDEENAPYDLWKEKLSSELANLEGPTYLVGHSIGASFIAKFLSEVDLAKPLAGVFLIASPFWGGAGWKYEGYKELELPENFSAKLPKDLPVFIYHCQDDEAVPFEHLALYTELLPQATISEIETGGHQLNNDLSLVADDIKTVNA